MAKDDDVQLVESINGIDGTPPTLDLQNVHIHGFVGLIVWFPIYSLCLYNYQLLHLNLLCWGFFAINGN
jgi:hypothetical protein